MVTLATIALTVGLGGCAVPTMPWQLKSGPLTPDQVLTVAKPAMVLVQVDYTASFSLPKLTITDAKYQVVRDKLQAEFDAGRAELLNHDTYVKAFQDEINDHPGQYFSASSDLLTDTAPVTVEGSGFIASADGYILTSAHVVATKDDEIKAKVGSDVIASINAGTTAAIEADTGIRNDAQKKKLEAYAGSYTAQNLKVFSLSKVINVGLGKATPGKPLQHGGITANLSVAGQPIPGDDVAILKIDGYSKLPSLAVSDEKLRQGEAITVVGFPGDSIFANQDTQPRAVEASQTHGQYQVKDPRPTPDEKYKPVFTNATATHGESGGPMLNDQAQAVGVTAFVLGSDANSDATLPNNSFAVPASVVKRYLAKAKVNAAESQTTVEYARALREVDAKHFRAALPMLRDVKSRWKDDPFVDAYVNEAEAGIVDKTDQTPPPLEQVAAASGAALMILVVMYLAARFLLGRRRKHQQLVAELEQLRGSPGRQEAHAGAASPTDPLPVTRPPARRRTAASKVGAATASAPPARVVPPEASQRQPPQKPRAVIAVKPSPAVSRKGATIAGPRPERAPRTPRKSSI